MSAYSVDSIEPITTKNTNNLLNTVRKPMAGKPDFKSLSVKVILNPSAKLGVSQAPFVSLIKMVFDGDRNYANAGDNTLKTRGYTN